MKYIILCFWCLSVVCCAEDLKLSIVVKFDLEGGRSLEIVVENKGFNDCFITCLSQGWFGLQIGNKGEMKGGGFNVKVSKSEVHLTLLERAGKPFSKSVIGFMVDDRQYRFHPKGSSNIIVFACCSKKDFQERGIEALEFRSFDFQFVDQGIDVSDSE